jgi:hypothetical protein
MSEKANQVLFLRFDVLLYFDFWVLNVKLQDISFISAGFGSTGFSFGGAASTAPSFSLGGGTTSTTNSGFGFGGLSSSIAPSGTTGGFGGFGSGFGSNAPTASTTTLANTNPFGGFGGFGNTGTTATTTQSSFQLAPTARPLFGQPQPTSTNWGEDHVAVRINLSNKLNDSTPQLNLYTDCSIPGHTLHYVNT